MNLSPPTRAWPAAVAIFAAALLLRLPFRSHYAYHWDSAQFALAVEQFDLRAGIPHAPGFLLYIALGQLVNHLLGDPHASLVWISVVAGALLPALGFVLADAMFGRRAAWTTAAILATSALTWFHSSVALTTIVDGVLVTATAYAAWQAMQSGRWGWVAGTGVWLAAVAGVRGQTAPGLLPVWLYALLRQRAGRGKRLAVAGAAAGLAGALWLAPLVMSCGGLGNFLEVLAAKNAGDTRYLWWRAGWPAWWSNLYIALGAVALGLGLAGPMALVEWWRQRGTATGGAGRFLWWWVAPMVVMGLVVFYTFLPGHTLCYFPALAVAAGAGVAQATERLRVRWTVLPVVIALTNAALFLTGWSSQRLRLNAAEIREHDATGAQVLAEIRSRYRPDEVVIVHGNQWFAWGFRHFQYHLPEYENWLVRPDPSLVAPFDRQLWRARGRSLSFAEQLDAGHRAVVWFTPPATLTVTNQTRWAVESSPRSGR